MLKSFKLLVDRSTKFVQVGPRYCDSVPLVAFLNIPFSEFEYCIQGNIQLCFIFAPFALLVYAGQIALAQIISS